MVVSSDTSLKVKRNTWYWLSHIGSDITKWAMKVFAIIGAIALLAMMLVIVANIIGRIFFKAPILGTMEISGYVGAILVAFAVGLVERDNGNIVVEVVAKYFPRRLRAAIDIVTRLLSLIAVILLARAVFLDTIINIKTKQLSATLQIYDYPFELIWGIGVIILGIVLIRNVIRNIRKIRK